MSALMPSFPAKTSRTVTQRLIGVTALLACTMAVAAPAHAVEETVVDPSADVVFHDGGGSDVIQSGRKNSDVIVFRADHRAKKVELQWEFRELIKPGRVILIGKVVTPEGTFWVRDVRGTIKVNGLICANATHVQSAALDLMAVILPRGCLSKPAWVKASGRARQNVVGGYLLDVTAATGQLAPGQPG